MENNEKDLLEFDLEDIIKEFKDPPEETKEEIVPEEKTSEVTEDTVRIDLPPRKEAEEIPVTGDTIRIDMPQEEKEEPAQGVTGDTIRMEPIREPQQEAVTGDTIRMDPVAEPEEDETPAEEISAAEAQNEQQPYDGDWEPEYEQPIGEYVPPRPILFHPRSKLRELKRKLVAGPEKQYYTLLEKGLEKLQLAIFFNTLVVLISAVATGMYALGMVQDNRMRLMVFGQFLAMLLSALLGSQQLVEGVLDLGKKRFTLNTLLVFSFFLCCADGVMCLRELRVPCCAAFSLEVTMSLWNAYHNRNTAMGQLDTMRKATHLNGICAVESYYNEAAGLVRNEALVEDFMDNYQNCSRQDKILSVYALVALCLSVAVGAIAGVLHGVSAAIQVAAVTVLAATPATVFITCSRPLAVLERRLHALGATLCGWNGAEGLCGKKYYALSHEDLFPAGTVKLNGVKFYGDRDSDQVVGYGAALVEENGGTLVPLFSYLLESRNGIHYGVEEYRVYENGGIGGVVNGEPVLVGSLAFLKEMGVEIPEGIRVNHVVAVAVDGELSCLVAITCEKDRAAAAGVATLCAYRGLKPVLVTQDVLVTPELIHEHFGIKLKRMEIPEQEIREQLRQVKPEEGGALAIAVKDGLAPTAYCVTGARALRTASVVGTVIHMTGGIVGIAMMLALAILGQMVLLTPANMFLYQLIWMIPGLLITEWTRNI